jgi:Dyp-type peroxidase family
MIRYSALAIPPLAALAAAPGEPVLNINEIQGNIVAGFNKDFQTFLFLRIRPSKRDVKHAGQWIRATLAPQLASTDQVLAFNRLFRATRGGPGGEAAVKATWINAAFSAEAIRRLVSKEEVSQFGDEAFQAGLAARSEFLGDPTDPQSSGNKSKWKFGGRPENTADLVVIVASDDLAWRNATVARLLLTLDGGGLDVVYRQDGQTLPDPWRGREHFGFKDGISQPGVRGLVSSAPGDFVTRRWIDPADPRSQFFGKPGQPLIWPGEFVLGLPRQSPLTTGTDSAASSSDFPAWARDGSYLVVRRLRQDFGAFWGFVKSQARDLRMTPDALASLFVGRWQSGSPIMRTPASDHPDLGADDLANNHFAYNRDTLPVPLVPVAGYPGDAFAQARSDFLGQVCPHFAHIRKVNPRDRATDLGVAQDSSTRLLLRRGIPYGTTLLGVRNPTAAQLKADRGLVFASYQSSIVNQFETIIRRWSNTPNLPTPGGHDPVIGQEEAHGSRRRVIDLPGGTRCVLDNEWVIPTGGGYFFAPSISAVRDILGAA